LPLIRSRISAFDRSANAKGRPGGFRLLDDGDGRHDLPGRAEPALEAVVLDEHGLDRVQFAVPL